MRRRPARAAAGPITRSPVQLSVRYDKTLYIVRRSQALSLEPGSLHPAHRLDAGTEGVVVLSRESAFASYFRGLMGDKDGQVGA